MYEGEMYNTYSFRYMILNYFQIVGEAVHISSGTNIIAAANSLSELYYARGRDLDLTIDQKQHTFILRQSDNQFH